MSRHSLNYRSVIAYGNAHQVTDHEERRLALTALLDHVVPGRAHDTRPPNAEEPAAVAILRLDLRQVSAKARTGGPTEEPEDDGLPYWSGQIPLTHTYGTPIPAADLTPGVTLPH